MLYHRRMQMGKQRHANNKRCNLLRDSLVLTNAHVAALAKAGDLQVKQFRLAAIKLRRVLSSNIGLVSCFYRTQVRRQRRK